MTAISFEDEIPGHNNDNYNNASKCKYFKSFYIFKFVKMYFVITVVTFAQKAVMRLNFLKLKVNLIFNFRVSDKINLLYTKKVIYTPVYYKMESNTFIFLEIYK